ncbi:MAG: anaerobic ribonucleoside-triphosphate reductase activating protein [Clostridiales bacterium]|nr:anaerobic ribonucleoside-triphosphate reductase activating protein [Clostridiales bacterium]
MQIYGLNKLTLLDYPEHLAATVFVGGCNLRCPFCQNASLVTRLDTQMRIPTDEIISYLKKRTAILEGVCITGGEPTIYKELPEFIKSIKELGYNVKLDTNGTNPDMLKALAEDGLIDYVAMDIKNCRSKYALTAGISELEISLIEESVSFLLESDLEYEFRTTIVKEYHDREDILSIAQWIIGAKAYFLQGFQDSGDLIMPGLHPHSKEAMQEYLSLARPYVRHAALRGID